MDIRIAWWVSRSLSGRWRVANSSTSIDVSGTGQYSHHQTHGHDSYSKQEYRFSHPVPSKRGNQTEKWLRKSEQGDKWNRCLIEGMIVLSETGARDEQTTPP